MSADANNAILTSCHGPMNWMMNKIHQLDLEERYPESRAIAALAGPIFAVLSIAYQVAAICIKFPLFLLNYTLLLFPMKVDGQWVRAGSCLLPAGFELTEMLKHVAKTVVLAFDIIFCPLIGLISPHDNVAMHTLFGLMARQTAVTPEEGPQGLDGIQDPREPLLGTPEEEAGLGLRPLPELPEEDEIEDPRELLPAVPDEIYRAITNNRTYFLDTEDDWDDLDPLPPPPMIPAPPVRSFSLRPQGSQRRAVQNPSVAPVEPSARPAQPVSLLEEIRNGNVTLRRVTTRQSSISTPPMVANLNSAQADLIRRAASRDV